MRSLRGYIEQLAFSDESDLRKYVPKYNRRYLPYNLRITSLDRIVQYFVKKGFSEIVYIIQCIIVILFMLLYIVTEYWQHISVYICDFILSLFYLSLMILGFIISDRRGQYLCMPYNILDIITVFPTTLTAFIDFIRIFIHLEDQNVMNESWFWIHLPYLRLLKILRIGTIIRLYFQRRSRGKVFTSLVIIVTLGTMMFVSSGVFMLLENEAFPNTFITDTKGNAALNPLYFHDSAYFIISGITTVGFGDFVPHSIAGRIIVCLFIILFIVAILGKWREILFIFSNQSVIMYDFSHDMSKHIIITGSITANEIYEFWKEFFDESHGKIYTKRIVVVINNEKEYSLLKKLSVHSYFRDRVTLICDDITNFTVLDQIKADRCSGLFILTNTKTNDPAKEDTETLVKVIAIKNYLSDIDIYTQYFLQTNAPLFQASGAKVTICIQNLEHRLLAGDCYSRGSASLISNLVFTKNRNSEIFKLSSKKEGEKPWIDSYVQGIQPTIHIANFSIGFIGLSFHKAAEFIFEHFDITLIGVITSTSEFLLNPYNSIDPYFIKEGDRAAVIARSYFHSQTIALCQVPDALSIFKTIEHRPRRNSDSQLSSPINSPRKSIQDSPRRSLQESNQFPWINRKGFKNIVSKVMDIQYRSPKIFMQKYQKVFSAYLRESPLSKESFFLKSAKHFSDHIIILVKDFSFATDIGTYLRSIFVSPENLKPIIFVIPPSIQNTTDLENFYEEFSRIKDIFGFYGDFHNSKDMETLSVSTASSILFASHFIDYKQSNLQNSLSQSSIGVIHDNRMTSDIIDADAAHYSLNLDSISSGIPYLASIYDRRNVKFFLRNYNLPPKRSRSLLHFLKIPHVDEDFERFYESSQHCASGKIFSKTFFTRLLCQSYFSNEIPDIVDALCGYQRTTQTYGDSYSPVMGIHLVSPDKDIIGVEYREVYAYFLKNRGICLGLYRFHSSTFSYTVCNPPLSTKIQAEDLIYVIGNYETISKRKRKADLEEKSEFSSPSPRMNIFSELANKKIPIPSPSSHRNTSHFSQHNSSLSSLLPVNESINFQTNTLSKPNQTNPIIQHEELSSSLQIPLKQTTPSPNISRLNISQFSNNPDENEFLSPRNLNQQQFISPIFNRSDITD